MHRLTDIAHRCRSTWGLFISVALALCGCGGAGDVATLDPTSSQRPMPVKFMRLDRVLDNGQYGFGYTWADQRYAAGQQFVGYDSSEIG